MLSAKYIAIEGKTPQIDFSMAEQHPAPSSAENIEQPPALSSADNTDHEDVCRQVEDVVLDAY